MVPATLVLAQATAASQQAQAAAPEPEASISQIQSEIARAKSAMDTERDGTRRFKIKRLLADLNLELAARVPNPEPPARKALTRYYDLLKIRTQPNIETDLLYRSAYAAELAGEVSAGIISLTRLINTYPNESITPEAYFRRAEMRFVYGNYKGAEADYTYVLQRGGKEFQLQSLYKRGWSKYKQDNQKGALIDELAVLNSLLGPNNVNADGTLNVTGVSRANQVLATDALHEMTLNFASLGRRMPPGYFAKQTQSEQFEYLFTRSLIDYYDDHGRFTDAANTAEKFATSQPDHPQAGPLQIQAITALDDGGLDERALAAKKQFVSSYGLNRTAWNGKAPLDVPLVRKTLTDYLDYITRAAHAAAQQKKQSIYYDNAVQWYDNYLKIFPQGPRVAELSYLRADILFDAGRYQEAAKAYAHVAYDLPASSHASDAAYAAVYAWRAAAKQTPSVEDKVKTSTLRFAKDFPQHPEAGATLARLGEDLYADGHVQQASAIADKLIDAPIQASLPQLQNAYRIRAAAALADNNYVGAEAAYRQLLAHAEPAEQAALREALVSAIYQRGAALVKAGDDQAAVEQFLRIQDEVSAHGEPGSTIRATALYDAAAASVRVGDKTQGAQLLETFRSTYPDNPLSAQINRKLAALYLDLGDNAKALREFSRVSNASTADPATRRAARLETAELYAKNGDYNAAITAYKNYYYDHKPPPEEAIEVEQRLVELYDSTGVTDKANFWRDRIIEIAPEVNTERSKTLAARAQLALADEAGVAFNKASLFPPLASSLKVKKARLQKALDAYGKAADYGIADVTTAATYQLGELYYAFNRALVESPRPGDLDQAQSARYETLVEQQAAPFKAEAIKLHQANADRAAQGVHDQWVDKSLQRLTELAPARYARTERLGDGIVLLK